MKSLLKGLPLLLFCFGALLVILGVVFNPSFVAKYVKQADELHPGAVSQVLSYQVYVITLGSLIIFASILICKRRYLRILIVPLIIVYIMLVYGSYLNKKYPENILAKPSELLKIWHVLLGKELILSDFQPQSTLALDNHDIVRAKYPVINVHAHFTHWIEKLSREKITRIMDACGVEKAVDLDGGEYEFKEKIESYDNEYSDKFILFYQVWFPDGKVPDSFFFESLIEFENAVKMGARGLKIWKNLGLKTRDASGKLIPIDDPRLDTLWNKAGELRVPVLIHVADPDAFFMPINRFNERFEQLQIGDFTSFYGSSFPTKQELIRQFENVLGKHPKTIFIGAHMAMLAENLNYLASLLNKYPNLYVELSAQVSELGRQPYSSKEFFIEYQDRILFGTDGNPNETNYRDYFRFLETSDEYFDYPFSEVHSFGRWKIYGLSLPDEVLEKIYYKNGVRILGLNASNHQ